jgi:hypothetical protein
MTSRLRLIYNLDNSNSFEPPARERPVDRLPYGQTEQRASYRRKYGYSPLLGIAVHWVDERDLSTLAGSSSRNTTREFIVTTLPAMRSAGTTSARSSSSASASAAARSRVSDQVWMSFCSLSWSKAVTVIWLSRSAAVSVFSGEGAAGEARR